MEEYVATDRKGSYQEPKNNEETAEPKTSDDISKHRNGRHEGADLFVVQRVPMDPFLAFGESFRREQEDPQEGISK